MSADSVRAGGRSPRVGAGGRSPVVAGLWTALVVAHVLVAQLTGAVAVLLAVLTRWCRPVWLVLPAGVAVVWAAAVGPVDAVAGLLAGPRQVLGFLAGIAGDPGRVAHLERAFAGAAAWLPRQLPLAVLAGAVEAAVFGWRRERARRRAPTQSQPGPLAALRRWRVTRAVAAGGVVTADGVCLGVIEASGRRATLSWQEIQAGVLCVGVGGSGTTTTALQMAHAAIRRRKPMIVVDLAGDPELPGRIAAACAATDVPCQIFGPAGPAGYDPLRAGDDPARQATLVGGMLDRAGMADQHRRGCLRYLDDLFAVLRAAPGDPRVPTLDEVIHLLDPAALVARAGQVAAYHPRRASLWERARVSAEIAHADPAVVASLRARLAEVRASPLGRWLGPAPPGPYRIDIGQVLRERSVAVFSLPGEPGLFSPPGGPVPGGGAADPPARAAAARVAAAVAALVAGDVVARCEELHRIGASGDGLVWVEGFDRLPDGHAADLLRWGRRAGLPALLTTSTGRAAEAVVELAGVVLAHHVTDPPLAQRIAKLVEETARPAPDRAARRPAPDRRGRGAGRPPQPVRAAAWASTADLLAGLPVGVALAIVRTPRGRVTGPLRVVPARVVDWRPTRGAGPAGRTQAGVAGAADPARQGRPTPGRAVGYRPSHPLPPSGVLRSPPAAPRPREKAKRADDAGEAGQRLS